MANGKPIFEPGIPWNLRPAPPQRKADEETVSNLQAVISNQHLDRDTRTNAARTLVNHAKNDSDAVPFVMQLQSEIEELLAAPLLAVMLD